ncbi:bifunctional isocitrate dehydrogenase kinase/phosphatase [Solemya velum gill symbiont]|uniref:bifunctional isocitrate dehydrogenase kinase/phosphatase n=1 Tax=Solemya velum gill symbiont TaxID=2340 RepID=UPI0009966041|nr:bifunctional isocitrate dehydrogenase kinase/phosphatase [Solemya velum gill symbiont]OOY99731.1 bifunctional isocitrate dehydrogenase kinase/phosphatase [Solemya velum gill symbiont]OOZ01916.1 bifunctional isocitrate dehydrogenase kinase/phosphatase [Solemya velum gill symbiont]OOZ04359.1 bifunctional isocitrate dehydrogenase kinase/phosphatase [Solemya velum gill symbiont]OOZ06496.1 bifunctional isocitrate dehydrogenase kinase/phosphatase [Solemya velum gill symbiont]OOZ08682.1 bifunction
MSETGIDQSLGLAIAKTVLEGFNRHFTAFHHVTAGAKARFEAADWEGERDAAQQRVAFYDARVDDAIHELKSTYDEAHLDPESWRIAKKHYILLLQDSYQPELAETFFNSVFCRQFQPRYFNAEHIFVRSSASTEYLESNLPSFHVYYPKTRGLRSTIRRIIEACEFTLPFENMHRDVNHIIHGIIQYIHTILKPERTHLNFQLQVINSVFFRNKAGYIVGRAINGPDIIPFALPILNNGNGGLYVDTVLLGPREVSRLFEFSYVYFQVAHPVPSAIVNFLRRLMPGRSRADLYSAIGYHKQGKTEFYRGFLHHLRYSDDLIDLAPGIKGMVMAVFTLPSYPYVFKIIRDRFAPPKNVDRKTVEAKYLLVKQHDRVGRMADTLEYSYVSFPKHRFTQKCLEELMGSCESSIKVEGDKIQFAHVYIERRMVPLNIEMENVSDERLDQLMLGYGEAVKEMAAANIFAGDLLFKNFGVTRLGRIVFYDYDEIVYLTECNFRRIPPPRFPEDEMATEPWYSVGPNDIFPEEFETFLLTNKRVKRAFMKHHADLLDPDWWIARQEDISNGILHDVFPYPQDYRFGHRHAAPAFLASGQYDDDIVED